MELGLHHSRNGRDECALYFFHLLFTWWWTCDILVIHLWTLMDLWWTCGFIWMDLSTYYYICDIYCDGCDMCGWMCGWMRYICDGWDIYVIYVCMNVFVMMECKKKYLPFWVTLPSVALGKGPLCRVQWSQHSAKLKKWAPRKQIFQLCRVLWPWPSAKKFKKKNLNFAECRP